MQRTFYRAAINGWKDVTWMLCSNYIELTSKNVQQPDKTLIIWHPANETEIKTKIYFWGLRYHGWKGGLVGEK